MRTSGLLAIGWMIALCGGLGTASGQPAPDAIRRADQLFQEGRALLDRGQAAAACPKFEESQRLDPGLGTLLNLADCYERTDRLASALTEFRRAEDQARSLGEKKRERAAADRAAALDGRVSRLTITLAAGARPPGFAVTRNGAIVAADDLGRAIAIDPGPVTIEATAPRQTTFATTIKITTARASPEIEIPVLRPASGSGPAGPAVDDRAAPPPPALALAPLDPGRGRRRLGYLVSGLGVAGLGGGVLLGVLAKRAYDDALEQECGGAKTGCSSSGVERVDAARARGTLGTIIGGVGVAAIAAGAVLWFTAPTAPAVEVAPMVGPDGAGVTVSGRF